MLIDSHCHLDFPDSTPISTPSSSARAKPASACMVTISTRVSALRRLRAIAEANADVFCSVGTHPHNAARGARHHRRRAGARLPCIPKSWRSARPGSTIITTQSPREAQAKGFRPHIAAARETGLPLVVHARDADDDIARSCEEETEKGAFPGVLHCFTGGPRAGASGRRARAPMSRSPASSPSRMPRRSARHRERRAARPPPGRDRRAVSRAGAHRGKRNEPAFVAHTAARACRVRGVCPRPIARADHGQFLPPVQEGAARCGRLEVPHEPEAHHPRLRRIGRRAARRRSVGARATPPIRRTGGGAVRCSWSGRAGRRHGVAGRHLARPARAAPRRRRRAGSTPCSTPTTTPTTPMASTICAGGVQRPAPGRRLLRRATGKLLRARFAYCFETPPGSEYPPILNGHGSRRASRSTIIGRGRGDRGAAVPPGPWQIESLGFRFGGIAYSRDVSDLPERVARRAPRPRRVDPRRAALHAASEPSLASSRRSTASRGSSRSAPCSPICMSISTTRRLRRELPDGVEPAYDGMVLETE